VYENTLALVVLTTMFNYKQQIHFLFQSNLSQLESDYYIFGFCLSWPLPNSVELLHVKAGFVNCCRKPICHPPWCQRTNAGTTFNWK